MAYPSLDPRLVRMPEFAAGEWLNIGATPTKASLRGQVLLIDFWEYSCLNCLRTFPYLTRWHQRYADKGLTIIGVHTPEFSFGHLRAQVEAAISEYGISYPVLLDNNYETWTRFANKAWPTKILVDKDGYIRMIRQGEGHYVELEQAIQTLLRQRNQRVQLPDILPPLREEDAPGAVCFRPTPELHAGYQGGGLFGSALGNDEGYVPQNPMFYELPESRVEGQFYVEGVWRAWPESLAYAGQQGGQIVLPYQAATVNAVLSPSADTVEVALDLGPADTDPIVVLEQDGYFLTPENAGEDVAFMEDGTTFFRVDRPRMYQLVRNPVLEAHELALVFHAHGLALYSFTFTGCVTAGGGGKSRDTYRVK